MEDTMSRSRNQVHGYGKAKKYPSASMSTDAKGVNATTPDGHVSQPQGHTPPARTATAKPSNQAASKKPPGYMLQYWQEEKMSDGPFNHLVTLENLMSGPDHKVDQVVAKGKSHESKSEL
ncbi:hypothetical protein GJ744_000079 [Endocarpon pusillum]|uniref:Uncharacterized protein n=1 Tax=Endocarpon pusillum TaxID=364733 RepID=A0A8H7AVJ1_9EURO|nr:hypothetical protein GJ744_000079 [Endocarpon pusillum]